MAKIVDVDFTIPANDIVKMLRLRADAIENGEVNPKTVILVEYFGHGDTDVFAFGANITPGEAYMTLEHGKLHLLDIGV